MSPSLKSTPNRPASPGSEKASCPKCKGETKRIEIEIDRLEWGRVWLLGVWAGFFPGKDRALVCEHCGEVFARTEITNRTTNRITGICLALVSIACVLAAALLLLAGAIGWF